MANSVGMNPRRSVYPGTVPMRIALAAGVTVAFVASFVGDADAASRQANRAHAIGKIGKKRDVPIVNPFGELPKGPLQMVVSIDQQHVTLYANGVRIAQSRVSTGTARNPTPTGVFSVIEKDRWHRSNLYDNAPMYYMQRLTWSGVAMHEGILPGYAASHGCIRMPTDFASRLWVATRLGVRVVIARNDPVPVAFGHAKLFHPKQKPDADQVSEVRPVEGLRPTLAANVFATGLGTRPVRFAQSAIVNDDAANTPDSLDPVSDTPKAVTEVLPSAAAAPVAESAVPSAQHSIEAAPPPAAAPIEAEITASPPGSKGAQAAIEPTSAAAEPVVAEPEKRIPLGSEPNKPAPARTRAGEPIKKAGQVAVFVSKKEKKIFVRQGFVPVFSMPVEIADPDRPLGTHVFTALELADGGARMRWNAITMPPERPRSVDVRGNKKASKRSEPAPAEVPSTAMEALDRIAMPQEAVDRISELLTPGSSLIVSDHGLGSETGRYTEFIVVTR